MALNVRRGKLTCPPTVSAIRSRSVIETVTEAARAVLDGTYFGRFAPIKEDRDQLNLPFYPSPCWQSAQSKHKEDHSRASTVGEL
jgi:hypothetical protein